MISTIAAKLHDPMFMAALLTAVAVAATAWTLITSVASFDGLERRMKAVAVERAAIRARERDRLNSRERIDLKRTPKEYMRVTVERLNLRKWLGEEATREMLRNAGYRGQAPYVAYLFFRMVVPSALFFGTMLYVFALSNMQQPAIIKLGICLAATYFGIKVPDIYLKNEIQRRLASIKRAFPDALDLLLICVESGMSVELAFRRVSQEIGAQSIALAEELTLTTAEMAYLPDRRQAFENLAERVDLEGVKAVCMALIQSERYGTPLGQTLRIMAQENRDMRMAEAEKRAAALPPKLTVPMILFFLPVLFVVILGPAAIQLMNMK